MRNFIFFCVIAFVLLAGATLAWYQQLGQVDFAQRIAESQARVSEAQAHAVEAQADAIKTSVELNDDLARAMLARERLNNWLLVLCAIGIIALIVALIVVVRRFDKWMAERGQ